MAREGKDRQTCGTSQVITSLAMLGSLNLSRSSSSSEGSCRIKSSNSARISCLVRKSTSFLFWLLHSCIMSSCSSISARVTVCLSSRVSMWLTARVLYFQNMVATGASYRALVCNSAQRLVMSKWSNRQRLSQTSTLQLTELDLVH